MDPNSRLFAQVDSKVVTNVLSQTDPIYVSLLKDPKAFSDSEFGELFGDRFISTLSREADRDRALTRVDRATTAYRPARRGSGVPVYQFVPTFSGRLSHFASNTP